MDSPPHLTPRLLSLVLNVPAGKWTLLPTLRKHCDFSRDFPSFSLFLFLLGFSRPCKMFLQVYHIFHNYKPLLSLGDIGTGSPVLPRSPVLCSALCLLTPSHMLPSPCTSPTPLEAGGWGLTKSLGQTWANFLKSCLQLSALFSPHLLPCCRRPKCSAYTTSSLERLSPPPPPTCLTRSCHNPGVMTHVSVISALITGRIP